MKQKLVGALVGAMASFGMVATAAPAAVYENRSTADTPTIDAVTFLNRGLFTVNSGDQPYDTQNTLNYTNFPGAIIEGGGGFRFDLVDESGLRRRAASFQNNGLVRFTAGGNGGLILQLGNSDPASWILINATNVQSRGGLSVDSEGLLSIKGQNVNVARSGIRAGEDPFQPIREGSSFGLLYSNDQGVSDLYWGVGQNNTLDPANATPVELSTLTGRVPNSGPHEILDATGFTNFMVLSATNVFAVTNALSPTNWVIQAVYVVTNSTDPQFKVDVKFGEPRIGDVPGAKMPIVRWTFEDIDTITAEPYTNYVYLLDSLGALTNSVLTTNIFTQIDQRPSNFIVTRVTPDEWADATGTNIIYTPDLIYNASYAAPTVTNWYSAYSAAIGSTASFGGGGGGVFGIPELSHPTNLPARVEIEADRLDLSLSRFRTDGLLSIKANDLVGTEPIKLDAAVVSMNVGRREGSLTVSNLIQPTVRRFNGSVAAWSSIWTNQTTTTAPDPSTPGSNITNTVDIRFHALIVEYQFITVQTVETYRFSATAPKVELMDDVTVQESFVIDSPDITLHSQVGFGSNPITPAAFPSAVNLTNLGVMFTSDDVAIGSVARPLPNLANSGFIGGTTIDLNVGALSNAGSIQSSVGDIFLQANDVTVPAGFLQAAANLQLNAANLTISNATLTAGYEQLNFLTGNTNIFPGAMVFNVSGQLADAGAGSSNSFKVYDGFQMVRRPTSGDLLGTVMTSEAPRFGEVVHTWWGEDRGATAAGFSNNSAIGELVLDGALYSLFTFRSPSTNATALYVDFLTLTNSATDIAAALNVEPGFTLYFADSNLAPEDLNGASGGRVRWVQAQAGARSGVPVTLGNGTIARVNRGLLRSSVLDSDDDGLVNAVDPSPFQPAALRVQVRVLSGEQPAAEVSWAGTPGATYRVEYSSNLEGGKWQGLTTVTQPTTAVGPVSVRDSVVDPAQPRFYRVVQER